MNLVLVDDHPLFREGVALLLASLEPHVEVFEADSCESALELIARTPAIDIVLMDLQLPGASGMEALRTIRERHPAVPVVVVSSSEDRATVLEALEAGAMGFVPKSSTSSVLKAALKLIMANGIYLPPSAFLGQVTPPPAVARAIAPRAGGAVTPEALGLTPRQSDVLLRILQGKSAKLISRELGLSNSTVKVHTSAVLRALNVTTRTQAVVAAGTLGLRFEHRAIG